MDILQSFAQIGFDWRMALANLVNFLIVFFLLKHFVFEPIKNTISKRKSKIEKGLEDAQKAKTKRVMAEEQYEKKIEEAKDEANQVLSQAHEQRGQIIEKAHEKAEDEAQEIIAGAKKRIKEERREMQARLREETAELVIDSVEKILDEEVDEEKGKRIIGQMMKLR